MIHPRPGDLIAVCENRRYYYAVILTDHIFLGGQLVYALHRSSEELLPREILVEGSPSGFHHIVDFIFAKRANTLVRLGKVANAAAFDTVTFFKADVSPRPNDRLEWAILDRDFNELKRSPSLLLEERPYPFAVRSDHFRMCTLIDQQWTPDHDLGANA